jgi:SAM-dependent methyltransferase
MKDSPHEDGAVQPAPDPEAAWTAVYDVLYGPRSPDPVAAAHNAAFLAAQVAYLRGHLPPPPGRVLDAGCGTGRHLLPLAQMGYRAVGVDLSQAMLQAAQQALREGGAAAHLVHADLCCLPFATYFDAALCLESPLAYLHEDTALSAALFSLHRALKPDGRLIVDVFDYVGTLGERPLPAVVTRFATSWGSVEVGEAHHYDARGRIWHMQQAFRVERAGRVEQFDLEHALRIRPAAEYVAALEAAGFTVEELLPAYPDTPAALWDERRIIIVARA